jgi:hypothetical protein
MMNRILDLLSSHQRTCKQSKLISMSESKSNHYQVVICGGGIIGSSIAFYLAKLGSFFAQQVLAHALLTHLTQVLAPKCC